MFFIIFATSVFASYMQPVRPMGAPVQPMGAPVPQHQPLPNQQIGAVQPSQPLPNQQYGTAVRPVPNQQQIGAQQPLPNQQFGAAMQPVPNQQYGAAMQPVPNQQIQQIAYPNMQAPATGTPLNCEHILDPAFCKGPAMQSGYICSWQENECESVDPREAQSERPEAPEAGEKPEAPESHEDLCEAFSLNQFACQTRPGCVFVDFECKTAGKGAIPNPAFNANGGHGVFPQGAMPMGAQPAPIQPMSPAGAALPGSQAMQPAPGTQPVQPAPGTPPGPRPEGPQFCTSLPEPQCFGPSMRKGELCMWDAEDYECVTASEADMEAICNQFYRDPVKCDQHENCFWDEVDKECAENTYSGKLSDKPMLTQICSNFNDVMSCASQAMCFWDTIANSNLGLCVNVIQAQNVCRVLDTAIHCSTNALCRWQGGICKAATEMHGLLQKSARAPASKGTQQRGRKKTAPMWQQNLLVGFGASVLGLTIGILASWIHGKYQTDQVSNDDYRDIMMDMNSQMRQVV